MVILSDVGNLLQSQRGHSSTVMTGWVVPLVWVNPPSWGPLLLQHVNVNVWIHFWRECIFSIMNNINNYRLHSIFWNYVINDNFMLLMLINTVYHHGYLSKITTLVAGMQDKICYLSSTHTAATLSPKCKRQRCCAVLSLGYLSLIIICMCLCKLSKHLWLVFILMCIHLFLQWDLLLHVDWRGRQQEVWVLQTPAGKPLLNPSSPAPWSHPAEPCLLWQICDMWKCDVVFLWGQWCVVWLATVAAGKRMYKAKNGHGLCQEH